MKHGLINKLGVAVLSMVAFSSPTLADQKIGSWQIADQTDREIKASCIMQQSAGASKSVFLVLDGNNQVQIGLRDLTGFTLLPNEDPFIALIFDGTPSKWRWSHLLTPEVVMTDAQNDATKSVDLEGELKRSHTVEVRARGFRAKIDIAQTIAAIDMLRFCEEEASKGEPAIAGEEDAPRQTDQTSATNESEAQRLGQALGDIAKASPVTAQYRCSVSNAQLYGIGAPNSDPSSGVTLTIAADGTGEINGNGQRMPSAYTEGGGTDGDIRSVAYRVIDIFRALSPANSPVPFSSSTSKGMTDYQAALVMSRMLGQGMALQIMGGRQRYLTVSLADDTVRFLDLTEQNQAANIATLDCVRAQ